MKNTIQPYSEHYMNCYLNNLFSIICSHEKDYKILSYMNDFDYSIIENEHKTKLHFDYSENFYLSVYNDIFDTTYSQSFDIFEFSLGKRIKFDDNLIVDIPRYISEDKLLFIVVDLFYFDNGGIFFKRIHKNHYILVIGYNQKENKIIYLDDGSKGYGIYHMEYDILYSMVNEGIVYADIFDNLKIKVSSKLSLDYNSIRINANRLIIEIRNIINDMNNISYPQNYYDLCDFLIFIQRSFNRHISNKYLLEYLDKDTCFNFSNKLYDTNKMLISSWYNVKARVLRGAISGETRQYKVIYEKIKKMFESESEFWSVLIEEMKGTKNDK